MLTEAHAPDVATEVAEALTELLHHNPAAVWQFQRTFHLRSTVTGLVESHKGSLGIEGALAELFPNRFTVNSACGDWNGEVPDEGFVIEIRLALQLLVEKDPLALLMLKRNQVRQRCSLEEALQALFVEYSRRARAYPY
jgi:hypothetical protein